MHLDDMTKKIKLLIGVNIVLLGLISMSLQDSSPASSFDAQEASFAVADPEQVADVRVGPLRLRRERGMIWSVNGQYLADGRRIGQLLGLLSRLEVKRPAPVSIADSLRQAMEAQAPLVEVLGEEGLLAEYRLTSHEGEAYALLPGGQPFAVHITGYQQDVAEWLLVPEAQWRDRHLLYTTRQSVKAISIQTPLKPEQALRISRSQEGEPLSVAGMATPDTAKLYDFLARFANFEATAYVDRPETDPLFQQPPAGIISMEDFYIKEKVELHLYPDGGALYGWMPATKEAVLLDAQQLQGILLPPAYFRPASP
jgi:hypothetical protein